MKRLIEILNYLKDRNININYISYDENSQTALIFMIFNKDEEKLIEISDTKFCFFNEQLSEFNDYTTEQVLNFLDKNL